MLIRLTKYVFLCDYDNEATWCTSIRNIFYEVDLPIMYDNKLPCDIEKMTKLLLQKYKKVWQQDIKLKPNQRTYCLIKDDFGTESYTKINLSKSQRSLLAQIRLGILPPEIEVGRFRGTAIENRTCTKCNVTEDELHFLFKCDQYEQERKSFLSSVGNIQNYSQAELFRYLCNEYPRKLAKFIEKIWTHRKEILYNC